MFTTFLSKYAPFLKNFTFDDFAAFPDLATQGKSPIFLIFFTLVPKCEICPAKNLQKITEKVRVATTSFREGDAVKILRDKIKNLAFLRQPR
jgi:hypothetical protein